MNQVNARLALATREAVHRSRNLLSIVSSIARRSARGVSDTESFVSAFLGRVNALSNATASVITERTQTSAHLQRVVHQQLDPLFLTYGKRVSIEGPSIEINTESAQQICLALHELATNAQKYGAMATEDGVIEVTWSAGAQTADDDHLEFVWREIGIRDQGGKGSPIDGGGFGTTLLMRAVPAMLQGTAERRFRDGILVYRLTAPMRAIRPAPDATAADNVAAAMKLTDHIFGTASPA